MYSPYPITLIMFCCVTSSLKINPGTAARIGFAANVRLGVASDQNSEMLQADAALARIFNDASLFRHCVRERFYRNGGCNVVGSINYRQSRNRKTRRSDAPSTNRQYAAEKTIFAIKPVNDVMHQFAWQRNLIKCPALSIASGSTILITASVSRDQTNVPGDASALA
jgi:hypothetical protein